MTVVVAISSRRAGVRVGYVFTGLPVYVEGFVSMIESQQLLSSPLGQIDIE